MKWFFIFANLAAIGLQVAFWPPTVAVVCCNVTAIAFLLVLRDD